MTIEDLIQTLRNVNVQQFCENVIQESGDAYIKLQRQQMNDGSLNSGDLIVPAYSTRTAKRKDRTTPDLYDTGDFYAGINLTVSGGAITIDSNVDYTTWIEHRYTPNIWGLDDDYKERFIDETLQPLVFEKLVEMGFVIK